VFCQLSSGSTTSWAAAYDNDVKELGHSLCATGFTLGIGWRGIRIRHSAWLFPVH
jgi:hypothetical protein